jgi:hypothetical protein
MAQVGQAELDLSYTGPYSTTDPVRKPVSQQAKCAGDWTRADGALVHEVTREVPNHRRPTSGPNERFEAMAREAGAVRLARLRQHLSEQAGMDLLVRRLVERGLIYRAGRGSYDFALPLFRDSIRRRAKRTELTRSVRSAAIGVDRAGDVR